MIMLSAPIISQPARDPNKKEKIEFFKHAYWISGFCRKGEGTFMTPLGMRITL